jgi:hypothetical protein
VYNLDFDSGNSFFCFWPMNTRNIFIEEKSVVCTHAIIIAQKSWFFLLMLLLSFQAITAACKWLLNGVEILANIGRTFFYPTWFWWPHLFWLSGWIGLQFLLEQSWVCTILYELRFLWSLQSFTLWKTYCEKNRQKYTVVKFKYSVKATRIWKKNNSFCFDITNLF